MFSKRFHEKWSASSRLIERYFRGAKGDYGWIQRKAATALGRKERLRMTLCVLASLRLCVNFDAVVRCHEHFHLKNVSLSESDIFYVVCS